jgi:hypothetical protein
MSCVWGDTTPPVTGFVSFLTTLGRPASTSYRKDTLKSFKILTKTNESIFL